jgi:hypothetical protein
MAGEMISNSPSMPAGGAPDMKLTQPGEKFDIYKVDYAWITK